MNLEERVRRLEGLIPREVPYGEIYDALWNMELSIGCPPGVSPEDEALRKLGDRETFVNDYRLD